MIIGGTTSFNHTLSLKYRDYLYSNLIVSYLDSLHSGPSASSNKRFFSASVFLVVKRLLLQVLVIVALPVHNGCR